MVTGPTLPVGGLGGSGDEEGARDGRMVAASCTISDVIVLPVTDSCTL
jgi:hypothetical protein